jgi:16S rRNA (cytosine1402-N4)-methyltransferase
LERLLEVAPKHLMAGGRLGVISFHSTEDRLVKLAFRLA